MINNLINNKYFISFIVAIIVFQITYGFVALNPTNINWLMSAYHDWGTHYLGWAFYRNDPWGFPLTDVDSYFYPIGTNVGFTDTIPLLALFFKIFSGILPEDFQFYGIWFLACYFLVAFYSIKILNLYKINPVFVFLGVFLITANPVLAFRGMHPSLCAHWLLLASIYNFLIKSNSSNVLKINKSQIILLIISATINPYLTAMVAGFNIIVPLKHYFYEKTLNVKQFIFCPIISFFLAIIIWIVLGLIVFENNTNLDVGNIYGLYAFNLNSFFNSYGHYSKFIPHLGMVTDNQHEGFGYLGIGIILMFLISFFYVLFYKRRIFKQNKKLLPLLILSFLLFVFSVSNHVSFGKEIIFNYPTLGIVEKFGNIFRAIGRFIWVDYYLIIFFSVIIVSKMSINKYLKLSVFIFLFSFQMYDIENLLTSRDLKAGTFDTKLKDNQWLNVFRKFDEIVTYPPFTNNLVYNMDYQDLSFLALKSNRPITNGYVARENLNESKRYKDSLSNMLKRGEISKKQLFVTNRLNLKDFNVLLYKDMVNIFKIDNFYLICHKEINISSCLKQTKKEIIETDSILNIFKRGNNFVEYNNKWNTKENIQCNIETYSFEEDVMQISGWAFNKSVSTNLNDSIFIALTNKDKTYLFPTTAVSRGDITAVYKKGNLDNSGFSTTLFTDKLPKQAYDLGIVIKDQNGKYHYSKTDKLSEVGKRKYQTFTSINKLPYSKANIMSNLETIENKNTFIKMSGWAALEKKNSKNCKIKIVLLSKSKMYLYETNLVTRNDVTLANENKYNYDYSGFEFKFLTKELPKGEYSIGVIIEENNEKSSHYKQFEKKLTL
jgi:hypothetical protein